MKRTKLCDRELPAYSQGEELMNMITHIVGGVLAVAALLLCVIQAAADRNGLGLAGGLIYGLSMVALYTVSSVYHGVAAGMGKKVMQVIDHCTIYLLIAGSYSAVLLAGFVPVYPVLGWGLFLLEWGLTALAVTLTAIDLKKYNVFSMVCYIGMGWAVIPFWRQALQVLGAGGFALLLAGGISYTAGAVLYGLGGKRKWLHSVFHIFVVLGSVLQFFAIFLYCL